MRNRGCMTEALENRDDVVVCNSSKCNSIQNYPVTDVKSIECYNDTDDGYSLVKCFSKKCSVSVEKGESKCF